MLEIPELKKKTRETIYLLRVGKILEATDHLTTLTHTLPDIASRLSPEELQALHNASMLLLSAQEKNDWASLADTLEYELTEILDKISL